MWADTLLAAERDFLLRTALWGACSLVLGVAPVLALRRRLPSSPLILHFAAHTAAWGAIALAIALLARSRTALRDYESARSMYALLGTAVGLDLAFVLIGATLAVMGWIRGRRLSLVGSGAAIVVQGIGWLVIQLRFAGFIRDGLSL